MRKLNAKNSKELENAQKMMNEMDDIYYQKLEQDCMTAIPDEINRPAHYAIGGIEVRDILRAKLTREEYRGYIKGNVLKYIFRAEHKGTPAKDYGKAAEYSRWLKEEFTNE